MRCEECGHDLNGIADTAPCTECGVVTPVARRMPAPLPGGWRMLWIFAWPAIAMVVLGLGLAVLADRMTDGAAFGISAFICVLVFVVLVGPVNTARQVNRLMQRLPRRVRAAPLLLLIPRGILVPVLAGIATVPIMAAIAFGACMLVALSVESSRAAVTAPNAAKPGGAASPAAPAAPDASVQQGAAP